MDKLFFEQGQKPFIIAEIGQTHDGNINFAHAFIDAVAKTDADAIKFQTHIASEESTSEEPWRIKFSHQDDTRYDYWKRMEFTPEQWKNLKKHADEKGLYFLSSPFSLQAIELLENIGVPAWKVGSGEVLSKRMINAMVDTRKPIIMSSGMSVYSEIEKTISFLKSKDINYALMQCTSSYPSTYEEVGLNVLQEYKKRFDCVVGLSDHSGTIWPSLAATGAGAEIIEVHVTMSPDMFGPDVSSSVTTDELKKLVEGANAFYTMRNHPIDKNNLTPHLQKMRSLFMKSIVARGELKVGDTLSLNNITEKKPAKGIPGEYIEFFVGAKLVKPLEENECIDWEHLDEESVQRIKKETGWKNESANG